MNETDDSQYSVSLDTLIYFSPVVTAWLCDVSPRRDSSCRDEHKARSSVAARLDAMKHLKVVHGLTPTASPSGQTQAERTDDPWTYVEWITPTGDSGSGCFQADIDKAQTVVHELGGTITKLKYHLGSHERAKAKERSFMKMAYATAELATCPRLSVGAVIVDPDGYIVASGRNGAPPGLPHCKHPIDEPCAESNHAELNAVIFAGRPLAKGGTMFVTHAPCKPCSGAILASGLKAVIYDQLYKNTDGIDRLVAAGIEVRKLG